MMSFFSKTKQKSQERLYGFTFIELLVVIAVIGFFASIVLVVIQHARYEAQYAHMLESQRNLTRAIDEYYMDQNDWPPARSLSVFRSCASGDMRCGGSTWDTLFTYLGPYLPDEVRPAFEPIYFEQDFIYTKGTAVAPSRVIIFNSVTGRRLGCVSVYSGYYLSFYTSFDQRPVTLNDGGFDPDGIESWAGDVRFGACP